MSGQQHLPIHISPLGAWAFAVGTSVGWGSLVVTSNTYLAQAGPMGSTIGMVLGSLIMLTVAWNYSYMMRSYPEAGGAYTYAREVFGYDQGFLTAWFLAMVYFAILWANATSLPLFGKVFFGDTFRFGKLYTLFGYDVYLGEALLSAAALLLFGFLCARFRYITGALMIALVLLFAGGITVCFIGSLFMGSQSMQPAFLPDASALSQIIKIAIISPWAFIGFESISHSTEEFSFEQRRIRRVMLIAVLSTLALYVMVTLLSIRAFPPEYGSWIEYIKDLDNLDGLKALPAFYAANRYMGGVGIALLMLALLALIITSLIGNTTALSRLFYAMAKDRILPRKFASLNAEGIPSSAIMLTVSISMLIPLIGRTAIGWIVDVTTIGATIIYALVSACALKHAKALNDKREMYLGCIGLIIMVCFGACLLLPNLVSRGSMAKETYFLFIAWSVLGFLFFRSILHRDKEHRFGSSGIVWVSLLALVLFISLIWMRQTMIDTNENMLVNIQSYYAQRHDPAGTGIADEAFIKEQIIWADHEDTHTILMAVGMFGFALLIMLTNHFYMSRRAKENERIATIDPMTGVKNKHAYLTAENTMNTSIAEGTVQDFSVVVCDLNGLKQINDTLGHKAGDDYIREACNMVCGIFKHSPVYRIGGDEFAVVLTGHDHAIRRELLQSLHDQSAEHIKTGGAVISAGMADFRREEDKNCHEVFERADEMMYKEKNRLKSLGAVTRDDS